MAGAAAMAVNLKKTDVVVVGLGAAGGIAVLPLTEAGLEVVGLEAGMWHGPRDYAPDELKWLHGWTSIVQKLNYEVPTARATAKGPYLPRPAKHPMMNAVGGGTIHYSAQSWRLHPWDFKVVSETRRRYGVSRIPKGYTIEDWPLDYEELEPYYDKVEYAIGVSGKAGNIQGKIDGRGNIFEGPRQREYPMPPLRRSDFTEMMAKAARQLGWHPYPGPAAITSQSYDNRPGCAYHGYCTGGGCHVNAKGSTAVTTIPKAQKTGRLKIVTQAHVTRVSVGKDGRVNGVTYVQNGETYFQPASAVLLASFVYENVRLLLMSKSKAYPKGLSNNGGQVGRHYFSHGGGGPAHALFQMKLNLWYGTEGMAVVLDDWADDNFDHSAVDFIGGAQLCVPHLMQPIMAATMNTFGMAPTWGSEWKAFIKQNAGSWSWPIIQATAMPHEENYLDLDPVVKDKLGNPVVRITAEHKENERKIADFIHDKIEQWYKAAGAVAVAKKSNTARAGGTGVQRHAYGGTRMGDNPETNVADRWGFSYEVPNLGFLGGSVMGTSGSRNPTETLQALAWRTADHLGQNWKSIAM
jgi:gluconate 2-dehydrogenase alpha chain